MALYAFVLPYNDPWRICTLFAIRIKYNPTFYATTILRLTKIHPLFVVRINGISNLSNDLDFFTCS